MNLFEIAAQLWYGRTLSLSDSPELLPVVVESAREIELVQAMTRLAEVELELRSVRPNQLIPPGQSGRPVKSRWSMRRAVTDGYKKSVWVYACIRLLSEMMSQVPWLVQDFDGATWTTIETETDLGKLWGRPNSEMSQENFIKTWLTYMFLKGEAPSTKIRDAKGKVGELWLINPDAWEPVVHVDHGITSYNVMRGGIKAYPVPPEDAIFSRYPDPNSPYRGLSPLEVASATVDTDTAAVKWNRNSLDNRGVPDAAISFQNDIGWDQYQEIKKMLRDSLLGPDNARMPAIVGSNAKWQALIQSAVDLDWQGGRRMNWTEICAALNVIPIMVGIDDHATYDNFQTAERVTWRGPVRSNLLHLAGDLNLWLTPDFRDEGGPPIRLYPDFDAIPQLRKVVDPDTVKAAKTFWSMGYPANAINRRLDLGFPDIPGGDVGYLPATIVPVGTFGADSFGGDDDL